MATNISLAKVMPFQGARLPQISNVALALISAGLLILAFPDFDLTSLAWVGLAPLILALVRERSFWRAFWLGEITGAVFFYGTCYFLSYSIINYGGLPAWLAYILIAIPCLITGLFPALFAAITSRCLDRFGLWAIFLAPVIWVGTEYARLVLLRMGWNSLGYSQAFNPTLIQGARFGGVYAVSFLLVLVSATLVFVSLTESRRAGLLVILVVLSLFVVNRNYGQRQQVRPATAETSRVVAVQPNVPMDGIYSPAYLRRLVDQHIELSEKALAEFRAAETTPPEQTPLLVVWPESPMNLRYNYDLELMPIVVEFVRRNRIYLLFNTLVEPNATQTYNSIVVLGPDGEKTTQYDKIYLMPFGEYVPWRDWIPFADRIPALVGDFAAGNEYKLSVIGPTQVGASICFEATFPQVARLMTLSGAATLVNLSNDGWFGPTPAARQHLAHAVFRAVENERELLRVTNTGITARIRPNGATEDLTLLFDRVTRRWRVDLAERRGFTFYTRFGDLFAIICLVATVAALVVALIVKPRNNSWLTDRQV